MNDITGNPILLSTSFQTTSFAESYDPYGSATQTGGTTNGGVTQNPYLFHFGLQDRVTGKVKFGNRFYDPSTGAWTQQDTLNAPLSPNNANRYLYAGGDPINAADAAGAWSLSISGSICAPWGGCLNGSVGVDGDGDVQVSGGVGVGEGGGVGAEYDPDGDYTSGDASVTESIGCNAGPLNGSVSTSDGTSVDTNATIGTSTGFGCSASVTGSYTF